MVTIHPLDFLKRPFFYNSNALVRAKGGDVTLDRVTLRASAWSAIYAENGTVQVSGSRIESNPWGVRNDTPGAVVDARHNWWGDPSGPQHPTFNPNGQGNKVTDGVRFEPWLDRFAWLAPTTMFVHGVAALSWTAFDVDLAGLTTDLEAVGGAGVQILGPGVSPSGELEWDTRPLAGGRYELRAHWRDATATAVGQAVQSVVVNNDPTIAWHGGRLTADETWSAAQVHVIEEDVIVRTGIRLTIQPGTIVKFTPGTRIVVEDGGILDAPATAAAPIILTAVSDDTRGDTNLDGTQSLPRPGDWKGVITRGSGQFNDNRFVDIRYCQSEHSGILSADEMWLGSLVHHVIGDVTVPNGVTLTIGAGAVVKFDAYKGLVLQPGGHLIARGAVTTPIVFTSNRDDTAGGDSNGDGDHTTPQPGDWRWIYVDGAEATFDHVEMRYGGGTESGGWDATGVIRTTLGATITLSNSVIRDGFYECILAWGGGTVTVTSSVIAGCDRGVNSDGAAVVRIVNSTIDDNRIGLWGHSGRLEVTNTLISNSLDAGIDNVLSSPLTIRYSDVWSAQGANYRNMADQTGLNGNIAVDPKYKDRARRNYRLNYVSGAIDAADSSVVPDTDAAGAPRYDDPRTANTGTPTSTGAFADLGAYEFVETAESDVNLVVTSVTGPDHAVAGERVTIEWTVTNRGTGVATGPWHDAISVVYDPNQLPLDIPITEVEEGVGVTLGPGQSYTARAEVTVPGSVVGPHFWQVITNARGDVFEGRHSEDNSYQSVTPVSLDLPELIIDGPPVSGRFAAAGESQWFKVLPRAGQSIRLALDRADIAGASELYVGGGSMPTRERYDARSQQWNAPDASVAVSELSPLIYYVLAHARTVAQTPVNFTIAAATADFSVQSVSPAEGGTNGTVTVTVSGVAFPEDATVRMVAADGTLLTPRSVLRVDATRLTATFDLSGAAPGLADIVVEAAGGLSRRLDDAFTVVSGGEPDFWVEIVGPQGVRAGREATFTLRWGNRGTVDAPMHLIDVPLPDQVTISLLPGGQPLAERLFLLTAMRDCPEAVIPPGSTDARSLYFTAGRVSQFTLQPAAVATTNAQLAGATLDWATLAPIVRSEQMDDTEWDAFWAQYTGQLGGSWATMLDALAGTRCCSIKSVVRTRLRNQPGASRFCKPPCWKWIRLCVRSGGISKPLAVPRMSVLCRPVPARSQPDIESSRWSSRSARAVGRKSTSVTPMSPRRRLRDTWRTRRSSRGTGTTRWWTHPGAPMMT